jgi:hypothetical protein
MWGLTMNDKDDEPIRRGDALAAVMASAPNADAYAYSALAALPAVQPVVKQLAWDDFEGRGAKAQAWKQANYLITWWKSRGQFEVVASYPGYQGEAIGAGFYPTLEAAKAAAQADYAALDVQPAPDVQCCMCGKKGLSTVEGDGGPECELSDGRWVCSRECYEKAVEPAPDTDAKVAALVEAAKAVVNRWDGPTWGGNISNIEHTADVINRLRAALAAWEGRGNE